MPGWFAVGRKDIALGARNCKRQRLDGHLAESRWRSKELSAEESYMRERAGVFSAPIRFLIAPDPAIAIIEELEKNPRAMAALTTHGRTAWGKRY